MCRGILIFHRRKFPHSGIHGTAGRSGLIYEQTFTANLPDRSRRILQIDPYNIILIIHQNDIQLILLIHQSRHCLYRVIGIGPSVIDCHTAGIIKDHGYNFLISFHGILSMRKNCGACCKQARADSGSHEHTQYNSPKFFHRNSSRSRFRIRNAGLSDSSHLAAKLERFFRCSKASSHPLAAALPNQPAAMFRSFSTPRP